jgi:hypothetical protein
MYHNARASAYTKGKRPINPQINTQSRGEPFKNPRQRSAKGRCSAASIGNSGLTVLISYAPQINNCK